MKKISSILTILAIFILVPFTVKAEEQITKESLSNAYREILACMKEGNHTEQKITTESGEITATECNAEMDYSGINMDEYITDTQIIFIDAAGKSWTMNYEIKENGDVLFSTTSTIDSQTTWEDYQVEESKGANLFIGYPVVTKAKGINQNDSSYYIGDKVLAMALSALGEALGGNTNTAQYVVVSDDVDYQGEATAIKESEFPGHAIEYAKATMGTQPTSFDDSDDLDTFLLTTTPDTSDDSKYVVTTSLLVKSSKDLSGINGRFANYITDESSKESVDPITNDDAEEENEEETEGEKEEQQVIVNPKTGYFFSIIPLTLLALIITLMMLRRKNYFNKI